MRRWRRWGHRHELCACSGAVAAPYGVPAASAGDIAAEPVDLIVTRLAAGERGEVVRAP